MGARIRLHNYALVERYLLLEEVGYVVFVVDFSAVFQGVGGVAGDVNCFGYGDAFLPEVQQGAQFAVAGEFDLAAVYGFFAKHLHEVACLEPTVFALGSVQHHHGVFECVCVVFAFGFGGEPCLAYGEGDFAERYESQVYAHFLCSKFYACFIGFGTFIKKRYAHGCRHP